MDPDPARRRRRARARDVPGHHRRGPVRPGLRLAALRGIRRVPGSRARPRLYSGLGRAHHRRRGRADSAHRAGVRDHEARDVGNLQGLRLLHQRRRRRPRLLHPRRHLRRGRQAGQPGAQGLGPARRPGGDPRRREGDAVERPAPRCDGLSARTGSAEFAPAGRRHRRQSLPRERPVRAGQQSRDERSEPGSGEGDVRAPGAWRCLRAVHERDRARVRRGASGDVVLRAGRDPPGHVEGTRGGAVPAGGRSGGGIEASVRDRQGAGGEDGIRPSTSPTRSGRTGARSR